MTGTVIVGAGIAGLGVAESLRRNGYAEPITLIGAEKHAPYTRPPLSKEVLRGDADTATTALRQPDEIEKQGIDLRLGRAAVSLDVDGRRVTLDDGSVLDYDHAVIATGAVPRHLPGKAFEAAHVLRTIEDALALHAQLTEDAHVGIVGAGFIGLEVAATSRARGCRVTVTDLLPTPLARVLPPDVGQVVRGLHEEHGVMFRFGSAVDGEAGLDADVVVVGIGAAPDTGWLDGSGLTLNDGVVCDAALQAAPGVWAVGDVARWTRADGRLIRLEHWTNATEQPHHVARSIVDGTNEPFDSVPYFWSDQYDAKVQSLGFTSATDDVEVVWGSLDEPKWVALLSSDGQLTGVVGMRAPGRVMKLRPLLAAGASYDDARAQLTG